MRYWRIWSNVRSAQHSTAQPYEPCESGVLHAAISDFGNQAATPLVPSTNLAVSRRSISYGLMQRRPRPMQAFGILILVVVSAGTSCVTTIHL